MRLRGILFAIALVFGVWNIFNQGLNVQSGAILLMILVCLAMNIYNYHQKQRERQQRMHCVKRKRSAACVPKPVIARAARGEERNNRDTVGVMAAVYS